MLLFKIILISLIHLILIVKSDTEAPTCYATISDDTFIEKTFNTYLYSKYNGKFSIDGKICHLDTFQKLFECLKYNEIYNSKWVNLIITIDIPSREHISNESTKKLRNKQFIQNKGHIPGLFNP